MKSNEMKTKVMHYMRFNRRYPYVATEVGRFNCDVLAANDKECVEVEIKCSASDLRADLRKRKHGVYKNPSNYYKTQMPHRFFFAVPPELVEEAVKLTTGTLYGVIEVAHTLMQKGNKANIYCRVVTPARKLKDGPSPRLFRSALMRMAHELIHIRMTSL